MKSINSENSSAAKIASILFEVGSIVLRPRQPFKYSSGILSPVYTDNRLIISNPKPRDLVVKHLIAKIRQIGIPDVVAGVATAGIPHTAFVAQKLNLPMVYVRPEPKSHGKGNQVEGVIKKGQKVIVIEDLISTGGSSIEAIKALRKLGAVVNTEVAIFSYGLKESEKNFRVNHVVLHPLTDLGHAAAIAVKKGFLKEDQIAVILDWAQDPRGWAKRRGFE